MRVLVTGGTIDKCYLETEGKLWFGDSIIGDMLKQGRCAPEVEIELLMQKDSLDLTADERERIADACLNASEQQLIITHGTDSMAQTAAIIAELKLAKTVVLTGAMVPFRVNQSDALFNLGSAVTAVRLLPHGVYLAMNGEIFDWHDVQKNRQLGRFERLSS